MRIELEPRTRLHRQTEMMRTLSCAMLTLVLSGCGVFGSPAPHYDNVPTPGDFCDANGQRVIEENAAGDLVCKDRK